MAIQPTQVSRENDPVMNKKETADTEHIQRLYFLNIKTMLV